MKTKNTAKLKAEVAAHVAADDVRSGSYSSCFVGCLANKKDDPELIEKKYGIPVMLTRICESVFEASPHRAQVEFFAAFPNAVDCDGKDLSRVSWAFLAAELRALPQSPNDIQEFIDPVIAGMDLLAAGKKWDKDLARAAADAADAAADAAYAATYAAYAAYATYAAYAADAADAAYAAARLRQRDTLLQLIKDAEVAA